MTRLPKGFRRGHDDSLACPQAALAAVDAGKVRMVGDLIVHPDAIEIEAGAYTMPPKTNPLIHYHGDNENRGVMRLDQLIANFNDNDGWKYRHNETDMRHELASRGWYEGAHENGHYLVLNLDLLQLIPTPDHPAGS